MRILITGGAGYIGHELISELTENSEVEQIIVYDNLSRENFNLFHHDTFGKGRIRFVKGELLDTRKISKYLDGIDVVYHLAAKVSTPLGDGDAHLFEQVNHWGTAELVYAVEESDVKSFVYLSSASVYGTSDEEIDINSHPNPKTFYGSSKLRGEKHVERLFDKMDAYVLRCANVFGYSPSARFDSVLNRFMFEANFIGRIQIEGNGKQHRSFIHTRKVVNVLKNVVTMELPSGTYNLVGKNLSVNDVVELIKDLYPTLETISVNQHLNLRSLSMKHDPRIQHLITMKPQGIEEDLKQFKESFAFNSFD